MSDSSAIRTKNKKTMALDFLNINSPVSELEESAEETVAVMHGGVHTFELPMAMNVSKMPPFAFMPSADHPLACRLSRAIHKRGLQLTCKDSL